jgi:hypothetical protein
MRLATVGFGILLTLAGCNFLVGPKPAGAMYCADWNNLTADQQSSLAKAMLDDLAHMDTAVLGVPGDHRSGLFAAALSQQCYLPPNNPDKPKLPDASISKLALIVYDGVNEIYPNCQWYSEPKVCS